MAKKEQDDSVNQIKQIYQYILQQVSVTEADLKKKFGIDFEKLLEKGFPNLEALGYVIRVYQNDLKEKTYVVGIPSTLENESLSHDTQVIMVFFVVAYYIYKQPEQKVIFDEIEHVFKDYLKDLDVIINTYKWLNIRDNYLYVHPLGKFVLMEYIKEDPKTGIRSLIDDMEKLF